MSTDDPEVSNRTFLDVITSVQRAVDAARKEVPEVPPRLRVQTSTGIDDAGRRTIIERATRAWLNGDEPKVMLVNIRFVVFPNTPAPLVDRDSEASVRADEAASAHEARAGAEDIDGDDVEAKLVVVPRIAVTYESVVCSANVDSEGIPLADTAHFAFPAGYLPKHPGLLIRYDEDSGQLQMRMGPESIWSATFAAETPLEEEGFTPVGNEGTLTFAARVRPEEGVANWSLAYRLYGDPAHLPAKSELEELMKRAGARMLLRPDSLTIAEIPASGTTLPVLDEGHGVTRVVRNLPTWCVYAYGSRRTGEDELSSFYKFYFCHNAADAKRLTDRLVEASRLAASFGSAVLPTTHRYLRADAHGQTQVIETVAGESAPVGNEPLRSDMHVVVAECDRVRPFKELLPTYHLEQLLPVARGLDGAHASGVVFGDVKPDNLTISQLVANGPRVACLYDIDAVMSTDDPVNVGRRTEEYTLPVLRSDALPRTGKAIAGPRALVVNDQAAFFATVCDLVLGPGAGPAALTPDGAELARAVKSLRNDAAKEWITDTHKAFAQLTSLEAAGQLGATPLGSCEAWLKELMAKSEDRRDDVQGHRATPQLVGDLRKLQVVLDQAHNKSLAFQDFSKALIKSAFWAAFALWWSVGVAVLAVFFWVVLT